MHLINIAQGNRTDVTYGTNNMTFSRVFSGELFTINYPMAEHISLKEFTRLVEEGSKLDNATFRVLSESLHT